MLPTNFQNMVNINVEDGSTQDFKPCKTFQAAEKLLQIVSSDTDANLYKYLDLVEITSQHYAMKQKFEPLLEDFLSQTDFKQETDLKKLQLR